MLALLGNKSEYKGQFLRLKAKFKGMPQPFGTAFTFDILDTVRAPLACLLAGL